MAVSGFVFAFFDAGLLFLLSRDAGDGPLLPHLRAIVLAELKEDTQRHQTNEALECPNSQHHAGRAAVGSDEGTQGDITPVGEEGTYYECNEVPIATANELSPGHDEGSQIPVATDNVIVRTDTDLA